LSKKDFAGSTNQTKFYERDASFAGFWKMNLSS
jgi:hypothetical protein